MKADRSAQLTKTSHTRLHSGIVTINTVSYDRDCIHKQHWYRKVFDCTDNIIDACLPIGGVYNRYMYTDERLLQGV